MKISDRKTKLVLTALELTNIGKEPETARKELRVLVQKGTPYESEEMKNALLKCQSLELRWKALEAAYLKDRNDITNSKGF